MNFALRALLKQLAKNSTQLALAISQRQQFRLVLFLLIRQRFRRCVDGALKRLHEIQFRFRWQALFARGFLLAAALAVLLILRELAGVGMLDQVVDHRLKLIDDSLLLGLRRDAAEL